ncbi:MAG: hypothetical protein R3E32_00520 [Chitinophagales bacterium]
MKIMLFFFLDFFLSLNLLAQNLFEDKESIYYAAVSQFVESFPENSTLLLERSLFTTNNLPKNIKGRKIKLITMNEMAKQYKKDKQLIDIYRIVPLFFEDNIFYINIVNFSVSYKKRNFYFANKEGGGARYKYKYDCSDNDLVLMKD